MISFLNKKSFLNTNQFKVWSIVNQPYKIYGKNNLVFGEIICYRLKEKKNNFKSIFLNTSRSFSYTVSKDKYYHP